MGAAVRHLTDLESVGYEMPPERVPLGGPTGWPSRFPCNYDVLQIGASCHRRSRASRVYCVFEPSYFGPACVTFPSRDNPKPKATRLSKLT